MSKDVGAIVSDSVTGLGYELVDFERTAAGMLRVYIDKPDGITVEDCADVSNHLSRVFFVENIDFSRLEISSPGLDRPLKTVADFVRFTGHAAKVKLNAMIENRRRFDGVIKSVSEGDIVFVLLDDSNKAEKASKPAAKSISRSLKIKEKNSRDALKSVVVTVPITSIERARLIPEI
jgi:ribosome maturation factor RimP